MCERAQSRRAPHPKQQVGKVREAKVWTQSAGVALTINQGIPCNESAFHWPW